MASVATSAANNVPTLSHVSAPVVPTLAAVTLDGPVLAVGSLSTASSGTYQSLVTNLQSHGKVERQMLDRLLDGGECVMS